MTRYQLYLLLCLANLSVVSAQQPVSPLINSYKEHLAKKEKTAYNLEWIQLGPTINGARVESV